MAGYEPGNSALTDRFCWFTERFWLTSGRTAYRRAMMNNFRLRLFVAHAFCLLVSITMFPVIATADIWTVVAFDEKGDGDDARLADAAQLSYRYDQQKDMLWFRVTLYGKPNDQAFGVNLVVDTGGDDSGKMNWWGANKDFKFDKLVTAWVARVNGTYQGTIGVGDVAGAKAK